MSASGESPWNDFWKWLYGKLLDHLVTPAGGAGTIQELGSGYSVERERTANVEKLRALGMEAVSNPAWIAHDITGDGKVETFCNRSARFVAEGMGYFSIPRNLYANGMIAFFASSPDWSEDSIERAHEAAMKGGLAFVCLEDDPSGHICAIAPEPRQASGSWGIEVPVVFNVGRTNGVIRLSQAFRLQDLPRLRAFILGSSVA